MKLARVSLIVPASLAVIALATASCKRAPAPDAAPAADTATVAPAPRVHFAKVSERTLPPTLEASGSITADSTSEVAAPAGGLVIEVPIDVGTRVKKGDVLVRLDPRGPSLGLAAAGAQAEQVKARLGLGPNQRFEPEKVANVRVAKEAMDLAVNDEARQKALLDSGSISQATWDQVRSHAEQTRAQYEAAVNAARQDWASLLAAESQASTAQKALSDTAIRAPFDGAIAERRISPGEFASMGKVVAVLVDDTPVRFKMDIAEADAGKVAIGKEVLVTVAAFPGRTFKGTIKRISASVKAQSRALPIEAEIANDDEVLKPGFFGRGQINVGGADVKALFVPANAIGNTGSASRVFVRAGTRVAEKIVTVGRELDGLVEVKGALAATDEIATDQIDKLSDGAEYALAN